MSGATPDPVLTPANFRRTSDPSLAYKLANTHEAAHAAQVLGVQTVFLAQVLVDSGVVTVSPRLMKKQCATYLRKRAAVVGPNDPISRELTEIADGLEAP